MRGMALDGHGAAAAVDHGRQQEVILHDGGGRELPEGPVAVVGEGVVEAGRGLGAEVGFVAFDRIPVGVSGDGAGSGGGGVGEGGMEVEKEEWEEGGEGRKHGGFMIGFVRWGCCGI